jgi:ferrous iron transport protein B
LLWCKNNAIAPTESLPVQERRARALFPFASNPFLIRNTTKRNAANFGILVLKKPFNIALVGNPNSGKSSLFNALTGLRQRVGNFPGVTVDKKTGNCTLSDRFSAELTDLPGTYSLYPRRTDEWVAYRVLLMDDDTVKPDMILLVADASNLKRNLLFCSQIIDLKIPVVVALTMMDIAAGKGTQIDVPRLERALGVPVVPVNPRKNKGITQLKKTIEQLALHPAPHPRPFIANSEFAGAAIDEAGRLVPGISDYKALHLLIHHPTLNLPDNTRVALSNIAQQHNFNPTKTQAEEIMQRYSRIKGIMQQSVVEADPLKKALFTERLDNMLLHRTWGYVILLAVLFLLFQSVFWIARYPMDGIEWIFGRLSAWLGGILPIAWWSDLLVNGVLAGLSGILVFVPQIMILFGLITLLEDTGYMARMSFLSDKLMRKAGLNGKSIMPMISGFACAVPAIMSARNIENRKERLLTILVTPFMSCSARLPVYTILIALVIPPKLYFGFLSLQGMVMMGLYLLGIVMALLVAYVLRFFIKISEKSYFILELPVYRSPRWKNALATMVEKARIFVFDAGKVIMVISLLLWVLSNFGPPQRMKRVQEEYTLAVRQPGADPAALEQQRRTKLLENSFAGMTGKFMEPLITPLGYDWKIGIALVTSFAAREVFVGTMATLYSVGEDDVQSSSTLREKMAAATKPDGSKIYTAATGISLMIFYVLAMQCMSTLAVVKRETRSWKWPLLQLVLMTALAYLMSWMAFRLLR